MRAREDIFKKADNDIVNYIKNGDFTNLKGSGYRFSKDSDIISMFDILHKLYKESKLTLSRFLFTPLNIPSKL